MYDLKYRGRLDQHIDHSVFFFGAYAHAELDFLQVCALALRQSRSRLTFADVGANVGQHSLFMSSHVDRVVAFEPNTECHAQFMYNIAQNGIDNIEICRMALGDADGPGRLGSGLAGNSGSRSLVWTTDSSKDTGVEIVRADKAVAALNIERLDIIKLDVEGHEQKVLSGLGDRLHRDRPILLFELVGNDMKGGFTDENHLRRALPSESQLFTLAGGRKARLLTFNWDAEEAVCIPNEQIAAIKKIRPEIFPK